MTIKEARLAAGLTQAAMSERLMISKRNIENWEAGKNICPAWAEALIIAELNRIYVKKNGGSIMKKVRLSVVTEDCTASKAQVFNEYFFDFDAAVTAARDSFDRLTDHDKAAREALYVQEFEVELPDDYEVATAEQLASDLMLGDVESDGFDACSGTFRRMIRESGDLRDREWMIRAAMIPYIDRGDSFQTFCDEYGWADWMNDFTDAADGEECTEAELKAIDKYLLGIWNQ